MADPSRSSSGPFARHNAPFTIVIVLAGAALTWFALRQGVSGESAADLSVAATVTTQARDAQPVPSAGEPIDEITTTSSTVPAVAAVPLQGLFTEVLLEGLAQPAFATSAPGDDRIYIIERAGRILIFDPATGVLNPDPYLDVAHKMNANTGIELGLLGLVFTPITSRTGASSSTTPTRATAPPSPNTPDSTPTPSIRRPNGYSSPSNAKESATTPECCNSDPRATCTSPSATAACSRSSARIPISFWGRSCAST